MGSFQVIPPADRSFKLEFLILSVQLDTTHQDA